METIEAELQYYKKELEGKVVYCPCDDVTWSNFPRYFQQHYDDLKLKGLIASCYYEPSDVSLYTILEDKPENKRGYWAEYKGDDTWERHNFEKGNGDFQSEECLELIKKCDVVITNPPFSLFRQFLDWILYNGKDAIIMGLQMASQYKNIFPMIVNGDLYLGHHAFESLVFYDENGDYTKSVPCSWYTTFPTPKPPPLNLTKEYSEEEMPMLSNYDAILINAIKDIPKDYYGEMAVPFTFLKHWNPQQFTITGSSHHTEMKPKKFLVLKGSEVGRVVKFTGRGVFVSDDEGMYLDTSDNTRHRCVFSRVLIKRA